MYIGIKKVLIVLLAIVILFGGIAIFIMTKSILVSIFLVIMWLLIIWQYFELKKDKETLKTLIMIEEELDKIIRKNS